MTALERMLNRAIKAAEVERASCQARVVDLTAFIRLLEEALEQEDTPTRPDNSVVPNGGGR